MIPEDDRRNVWFSVVDMIDRALDEETLPPIDRDVLRALRRQANERICPSAVHVPDFVPAEWETGSEPEDTTDDTDASPCDWAGLPRRSMTRAQFHAIGVPDGIAFLGLSDYNWVKTELAKAGLYTIADVEWANRDGSLADTIGGYNARIALLNAVDWYRTRQRLIRNAYAAAGVTPHELANGPGGIFRLDVSGSLMMKLFGKGILLVADLERLDEAGKLETVRGVIGPRTAKQIRAAIERYRAAQATGARS